MIRVCLIKNGRERNMNVDCRLMLRRKLLKNVLVNMYVETITNNIDVMKRVSFVQFFARMCLARKSGAMKIVEILAKTENDQLKPEIIVLPELWAKTAARSSAPTSRSL